MKIELDHVFILCSVHAPEAARLEHLGVQEGLPNTHPGQGTACRRFLFRNAYLELLWVCNEEDAQSVAVRRTQLWDRWANRQGHACPFGIVVRPTGDDVRPPFDTWEYRAPYLSAPLAIHIAREVPLNEPAFFYLPFQRDAARIAAGASAGSASAAAITHVSIGGPVQVRSAAAQAAEAAGWFATELSQGYTMTLQFDGAVRGLSRDLQPELPLVLKW